MKVAVIGASGQLGGELCRVGDALGFEILALTHHDIEIRDEQNSVTVLRDLKPDCVINCAAFVDVENSENNIKRVFDINALGAYYVARACKELNAHHVFISTNFVFDGKIPKSQSYNEDDAANPINIYGLSKWTGEQLVQQVYMCHSEACRLPRSSFGEGGKNLLIVRVSSLFGPLGPRGKKGTFIHRILREAQVGHKISLIQDQWMSPTYAPDAARIILKLVESSQTGLFHVANSGHCSWYELGQHALNRNQYQEKIEPVSHKDFPSKVIRPVNTGFNLKKIEDFLGERVRPWQEAVDDYLRIII
ncbi:MAG: dTDP-4-dehydrorhamnose reductase [Deltaproteobacteria bacterium]|nr:dTDP-4-dehydrorhamnose reductase [Deltaproteobacteria bacterium]